MKEGSSAGLTRREYEALRRRCSGMPTEAGATEMGISENAFNLLCQRATKALAANNMYNACFTLGAKKAKRQVKITERYRTAGNNPGPGKQVQIAAAREGERGRSTTLGTGRKRNAFLSEA